LSPIHPPLVAFSGPSEGLAVFKRAFRRVHTECDGTHAQAQAAQQDSLAWMRAFSSWSKQLIKLSQTWEDRQILLCQQKTDLEVQEAMLVEEQACGLHPHDGQDLSAELE
jgi:hypothetical protein